MDIRSQFNLIAKEYDENRKKFIPCFDAYYASMTDFVAKSLSRKPTLIFDLGSGTGLLPSFWLPYFPEARFVLVDLAEEMLAVAKKRFAKISSIQYEIADYTESLPEGTPELVLSALSIHHLEHDRKRKLFRMIYSSLAEGGTFVNYDQFCSGDEELDRKIESYWMEWMKEAGISEKEHERWLERKKLDRECTVAQELVWLKEAGFKNAQCLYLNGKFAVLSAEKQSVSSLP
ncbi:MAG: class I SAM-dependent methyltransferase [Kiritimatiellia bacterium]